MPEQTSRGIRNRARNLAWEQIAPAEAFDHNPPQEAVRISDTIAHIQEGLQERARIAQNTRNEFVAGKVRDSENRLREKNGNNRAGNELPARMTSVDRERLAQTVIASLSPEDVRKLAELDRYVVDTREAVYRGFETIDLQKREMELVRVQSELPRPEPRSLQETSQAAPSERIDPPVSTRAIALAGGQERQAVMNGLEREVGEVKLSPGRIDSDREWHFDSLRDVLNQEKPDGGAPTRNYTERQNRDETLSRILDR